MYQKDLDTKLENYSIYHIDSVLTLKFNRSADTSITVLLVLEHDTILFNLIPNEVRSERFISSINGQVEKKGRTSIPDPITFRGFINGNMEDELRMTFSENYIRGYFEINNEKMFIDQLRRVGVKGREGLTNIVIYREEDIKDENGYCGVTDEMEKQFLSYYVDRFNSIKESNVSFDSYPCRVLELATDADYAFYLRHGTYSNDEVFSIINMIQGVYSSTFNLQLNIVYQNLWTVSDPYIGDPTTDIGAASMLASLKSYWQSNLSFIQRDLVHLFTGKRYDEDGTWGIAYLGGVCVDPSMSYGLTRDRLAQFTTTAHEIGHNLSGVHSDGVNCGSINASIMCQGFKQVPMYFSTASVARIGGFINANSGCLGVVPIGDIEGNNFICSGVTNQYSLSLSTLPPGYNVNWSVTGGLSISGSSTSPFINVVYVSGVTNQVTATITGPCGVYTRNINVVTGAPEYTGPVYGDEEVCSQSFYYYSTWAVPGATGYNWEVSGGTPGVDYLILQDGSNGMQVMFYRPGWYTIIPSAFTPCGTTYYEAGLEVYVSNCSPFMIENKDDKIIVNFEGMPEKNRDSIDKSFKAVVRNNENRTYLEQTAQLVNWRF